VDEKDESMEVVGLMEKRRSGMYEKMMKNGGVKENENVERTRVE
jgi:hypothetical protein